jgi:NADH-quinone oxidoreductase subunit N
MYLTPATAEGPLVARGVYQGTMVALAIPTVALGVYWGPLYDLLASSLTIAH